MGEVLRFRSASAVMEQSRESLADGDERSAALDIARSWIVEAPAGSGKTGLLIQRFLKLLADEQVQEPEEVLGLTFTHKAAAEMRDRVFEHLERAEAKRLKEQARGFEAPKPVSMRDSQAGHSADEASEFARETGELAAAVLARDRELHWRLLERPERIQMRTIDSLAAEIASSLPLLAGGGGRMSPVEDAAPLYLEAAKRTLLQLGGTDAMLDAALRDVLLHRDGSLTGCETLLAEMLEWRDQWGELVPFGHAELTDDYLDREVLPRLDRSLDLAICAALTVVAKRFGASRLRELTLLTQEMAGIEGWKGQLSPIAFCADRQDPEALAGHLHHWRALVGLIVIHSSRSWRRGFAVNQVGFNLTAYPQLKARLKRYVEELQADEALLEACCALESLPPVRFPEEQWTMTKSLLRLLSHALVELQLVFSERQQCDFAEMSLAARTALRNDEDGDGLEAVLGLRLRHLLVDEVQDTSTAHYEFLELLTQGWDGASQTVLLVGDPKQSIYLFRQARVERFLGTFKRGRLGEIALGSLSLSANFRSQEVLVARFNEDFREIFSSGSTSSTATEVRYGAATAVKPATVTPGRLWHASVLPVPQDAEESRTRKRDRRLDEAREVRRVVLDWRARPLPAGRVNPWRIAVLVRSRGHLQGVMKAFRQTEPGGAIPFRAVEIEPLGERAEVLDLLALTRALLHPADRVAWLAVLHAPWCGLGLADLHQLAGADSHEWSRRSILDAIVELGDRLSPEGCLRLERVWPVLDKAQRQRAQLPLARCVEETWRQLRGDTYLTTEQKANAFSYLDLLEQITDARGGVDLDRLSNRMQKLYAAASSEAGAVDLMTIHGAKGLEWDVVLVPGLERSAGQDAPRLLNWEEMDTPDEASSSSVMLAPIPGKGKESSELNRWVRSIRSAREAAERRRLFYVACTRAKEELHLFGTVQISSKGELKPGFGSLLESAWPAAEPWFTEASIETVSQQSGLVLALAAGQDIAVGPGLAAEFDLAAESHRATEFSLASEIALAAKADLLAVASEPKKTPPLLLRLRLEDAAQATIFSLSAAAEARTPAVNASPQHFVRPEGSFEAKCLGNAVHAFLEMLAERIASGETKEALLSALVSWRPSMVAFLRGEGLATPVAERLARKVEQGIWNTLNDAVGRWIVSSHGGPLPASEYQISSWTLGEAAPRTMRLDRIFTAGEGLLSEGDDCTWVVDYKTTTHGSGQQDEFLERERSIYASKMEEYGRAVSEGRPIRLALYYPMLPATIWWEAGERTGVVVADG